MHKHTQTVHLHAPKPRNIVVRAMIALGKRAPARHADKRHSKDQDRRDLAQRVRELGEW